MSILNDSVNALQIDLYRCLQEMDLAWTKQTNKLDQNTNLVYACNSYSDCQAVIRTQQMTDEVANMFRHRWYNFKTSIMCENLFCAFGAEHCRDRKNHDVDIYIRSIPFDVKLTVVPNKASQDFSNLTSRESRDRLIKWFYENQSQESRKQLLNRLYIVCDGSTEFERMKQKCNFEQIGKRICNFMEFHQSNPFNTVDIPDGNKTFQLMSDIIYIR